MKKIKIQTKIIQSGCVVEETYEITLRYCFGGERRKQKGTFLGETEPCYHLKGWTAV